MSGPIRPSADWHVDGAGPGDAWRVNAAGDGYETFDASASATSMKQDRTTAAVGSTQLQLGATPDADSLLVWKQTGGTGAYVLLWNGVDYTLSGDVITFTSTVATGDVIADSYRYAGTGATSAAFIGYAAAILANSPLAYWRLGEASGTSAADSSGNSRTGTYVGTPTLAVTGIPGGGGDTAVTFNGTSQYVTVVDNAAYDVSSITVEAWIKTTSASASMSIVGRDENTTTNRSYNFRVASGKFSPYFFLAASSTTIRNLNGTATVNDGAWHHVAFTYDGSNAYAYVDGVQDTTLAISGSLAVGLAPVLAARHDNSGSYAAFFAGTIDEVAIYSTALTPTQITAHHTAGA